MVKKKLPGPGPKYGSRTRTISLRTPVDIIRAADREAKRRGCSRAEVIISTLMRAATRWERKAS